LQLIPIYCSKPNGIGVRIYTLRINISFMGQTIISEYTPGSLVPSVPNNIIDDYWNYSHSFTTLGDIRVTFSTVVGTVTLRWDYDQFAGNYGFTSAIYA